MGAVTSILSGIGNNCKGLSLSFLHSVVNFSMRDEAGLATAQANNARPVNTG